MENNSHCIDVEYKLIKTYALIGYAFLHERLSLEELANMPEKEGIAIADRFMKHIKELSEGGEYE